MTKNSVIFDDDFKLEQSLECEIEDLSLLYIKFKDEVNSIKKLDIPTEFQDELISDAYYHYKRKIDINKSKEITLFINAESIAEERTENLNNSVEFIRNFCFDVVNEDYLNELSDNVLYLSSFLRFINQSYCVRFSEIFEEYFIENDVKEFLLQKNFYIRNNRSLSIEHKNECFDSIRIFISSLLSIFDVILTDLNFLSELNNSYYGKNDDLNKKS